MTFETIITETGRRIAALAGQMLTQDLTARLVPGKAAAIVAGTPVPATKRARHRRKRGGAENLWIADSKARRVPTFVIQMTGGLDTKAKVVERFGEGARFEKGKPPPAALTAAERKALKHPGPVAVPATTQRQAAA